MHKTQSTGLGKKSEKQDRRSRQREKKIEKKSRRQLTADSKED